MKGVGTSTFSNITRDRQVYFAFINNINKSRSNGDALYLIKFLSVLNKKLQHIQYIKKTNDESLVDWVRHD